MIKHNVDFMWLAEGHTPDHATLKGYAPNDTPMLTTEGQGG
jgi:hypothetical protein